jgi:hypothetical protein
MLLARDGCERRTGVSRTAVEAGVADRAPRERVRVEPWRDGRTGRARPLATPECLGVWRLEASDEVCEHRVGGAAGRRA